MNTLFNATDIAKMLGVSKRTIQMKAKDGAWAFEIVTARGGKIPYYSLEDLPPEVASIMAKQCETKSDPTAQADGRFLAANADIKEETKLHNRQKSIKDFAGVTGNARKRAMDKADIVNLIRDFQTQHKLPKIKAIDDFCILFNSKHCSIDPKYFQIPSISRISVMRWQKALSNKGIMALVGNYGKTKGSGIIDSNEQMKSYCLALINQYPHIKGSELQKALMVRFDTEMAVPSATTCRGWLKRWKSENASLYMSMFDPSGWQNKHMSGFGNMSVEVERINQLWEFDSTPVDVMLEEGRYSILGVLDVFTRRVKLVLKPTSNAMGIACLIREALIDWGVPEIARTDNGADYIAHHIKSIWDAFDIENDVTNPYSGWEKPYIERFFRTFSGGISEMLPGYIGHNVADREKISARNTFAKRLMEKREKGAAKEGIEIELNAAQFQKIMDQWVNDYYHHAKHSKLGCSPFEKFTSTTQVIKKVEDERVLDVLLAPVPGNGTRVVMKEGISVEGGMYIHAELGIHIGERVYCRYNPQDVGKIYVFHSLENTFICEAVNTDIADSGITMEHAYEAKKLQRADLAAKRKEFKRKSKEHDVSDGAQKFLDYHSQKNGGLTDFPKPQTIAENSSIQAAAAAAKNEEPQHWTDDEINVFEQRRAQIEVEKELHKPSFTTPLAKAIYITEATGNRELEPMEKAFLHEFRRNNKYCLNALDSILQKIQIKKGSEQ